MRQSELDTAPARLYATLLTFRWADEVRRYAAFVERVTQSSDDWGGLTTVWSAVPAMKVEFSKQHGGVEDAPVTIFMPADLDPATGLISGVPFADVDVLIEEMEPGNDDTLRPIFSGRVTEATYNPQGMQSTARLKVSGVKSLLDLPCGASITNSCIWLFGDANCQIDVDALKVPATVNAIDGSVVTLSVAGPSAGYYHRGWVERDGARIMIREYTTGNDYTLVRPPPSGWNGQIVTLVPGCDKAAGTCNTRWLNLARFGGAGLGIPGYNPLFETAS